LKLVATRTVQLDRALAEYGPETRELRHLLRQLVEARIHELWQGKGLTEEEVRQALGRGRGIETIQRRLLDLTPQNDAQHWFRTAALDITNDIAKTRWTAFLNLGRSIQTPFLVMLVFWLTAIFASFGVFAPRNGNVIATLVVGALSVAGAIFLIVEMDHPISGLVRVPMAPVEAAWEELDKP
jgi:hypothetical protein